MRVGRRRKPGPRVRAHPPARVDVEAVRFRLIDAMSATSDGSRVDRGNADAVDGGDRLIFLAEALTLVPFSETTLRRAISRGELEAWQPHDDGKLVLWRNSLIEWATRRPAGDRTKSDRDSKSRSTKPAARQPRRAVAAIQRPDPIRLADVG